MLETTGMGLLSVLILLPIVGAILTLIVPDQFHKAIKGGAVFFTGLTFVLSLGLLKTFEGGTFHFQFSEYVEWLPQWGISWHVGIDGLSLWMVLLTTLLTFLSTIFSVYVNKRAGAYFAMMLLLETAMLGVFCALDTVLFYTFFELSLIPMFVMIAIWGGANKKYASMKFFIYTLGASIFMLIGIVMMAKLNYEATGVWTFDLLAIQSSVANGSLWAQAMQIQPLIFWSFAIAFMVKCPMFPFHTWLPDAHTEAPTAGSILLAGVLLKMGTYGFLRFLMPLFPDAVRQFANVFVILAVIGIIYGAIVAAMQTDIKKLVAYSSVSHMGFVVLGIFSLNHIGIMGGAYQQLAHGISTGALFLMVGLLYERIHTRKFKDLGGLKAQMPWFSALFLIVMLSSVGLPGTNGFIGEFLALMGAVQSSFAGLYGLHWWMPVVAGIGVILAAVYLLKMFQKTFYGEITNPMLKRLKDLKRWEIGLVGVFVVFIFWGGLYPNTFLHPMERSLEAARLMSISEPGQGPSWSNSSHEINDKGDLVVVGTRTESGGWDKEHPGQPIMLASHFVKPEPTEYTAPQPPEAPHGDGHDDGHEEEAGDDHAEEEEVH